MHGFYKSKYDSITWNALITGLLVCGYSSHVGKYIGKMYLEKIHVACGIYTIVLKACSSIYALNKGQKIQTEILLKGYKKDLFVGSNFVDLNAKCCASHEAWIIVKDLFVWGDVLWNVLLFGYSNNGFSQEVLMCLHIM
mgnify:CR=1 FL=1